MSILIPVVSGFSKIDLSEWQKINDLIAYGVVLYWKIPEGMGADRLDLTKVSNLGIECSLSHD